MKLLTVIAWFLKKLGYKYTLSVERNNKVRFFTSLKGECNPSELVYITGDGHVGIGT